MTAYIIGSYSSRFGRMPDRDFRDLTREAVTGVLRDAGMDDGDAVGSVWFGNVLMSFWDQHSTRGQFTLIPLVEAGILPKRLPITNVEGACATGSIALHGAVKDILSGEVDIALAVGVEKTVNPDRSPQETIEMFRAGENKLAPDETMAEYRRLAEVSGQPFALGTDRTVFMDTYGAQANYHMYRYGTTQQQLAVVAAKNHSNGALNPLAQYRFEMTPQQVLEDRLVTYPLTRSMCAPIGDGSAAAIVCSERTLEKLAADVRDRAVRVAATAMTSGVYRDPDEPSLSRIAADIAYRKADVKPEDVDVAEVHDATAFGEIYQSEMLRLCPDGEGGLLAQSGATAINGTIPINTSGGLLSKGHPIAASGLSMTHEIVTQLRGEADGRQVKGARVGIVENGGGIIGLEEAACCITLLRRD